MLVDASTLGRTDCKGNPVRNIILSAIPDSEYYVIGSELQHVALAVGCTLHEPCKGIEFCYFPNTGLISLIVELDDGKTVEVGVSGYEGMTGMALLGGLTKTTHRAVIEVAGDGFRIPASVLQVILPSIPHFRQRASRFATVQAMQIAQTAACNRLHDVRQRMARWLLMTDDRIPARPLHVTHDFLSMMLGTDRPSVTAAAQVLQEKGAIQYRRGKLNIVGREHLETAVCSCYRAIQQFDRELGLHGHIS